MGHSTWTFINKPDVMPGNGSHKRSSPSQSQSEAETETETLRADKDTLTSEEVVVPGNERGSTDSNREALTGAQVPRQTLPLALLGKPKLCQIYPERRDEILELFLKRTTFEVDIWVNYTAASRDRYGDGQTFYWDEQRLADCGKLQLRASALERLEALDPHRFEMSRVIFNVGTPFRTLYQLELLVRDGGIEAYDYGTPDEHRNLEDFLVNCVHRIENTGIRHGRKGMVLEDLKTYAAFFRKQPDRQRLMPRSGRSASPRTPSWATDEETSRFYLSPYLQGFQDG